MTPAYTQLLPADGWKADLEMRDGTYARVPVTAWTLSEHGTVMPCVVIPGTVQAVVMDAANVAWLKREHIRDFTLYHHAARTAAQPYAAERERLLAEEQAQNAKWDVLQEQRARKAAPFPQDQQLPDAGPRG